MSPNRTNRSTGDKMQPTQKTWLFKMPDVRPRPGIGPIDFAVGKKCSSNSPPKNPFCRKPTKAVGKRGTDDVAKSLMDMDDTLLNAVDLANIEQLAVPHCSKVTTPPGSKTILRESRFQSPASSPIPKKTKTSNGFIILDMTVSASSDSPELNRQKTPVRKLPSYARSEKPKSNVATPTPPVDAEDKSRQALDEKSLEEALKSLEQSTALVSKTFTLNRENGDMLSEEEDDPLPCYQQSNEGICASQMFMEEANRMGQKSLTRVGTPLNSNDTYSIVKNSSLCSQYIRMARTMVEENHANILDDQVDTQLARNYDSSQQQREVERVFAECERTLIDVSNIELQPIDEAVPNIDDINWETDVTIAGGGGGQKEPDNRSILNTIFNKRSSLPTDSSKKRTITSYFQDRGPFFGLPSKVKLLLKNYRRIEDMYDWQKECLSLPAIGERNNLIYALPTSGGKTLVAEIIMFREILLRQRNAMFIVPYVSLAQEKLEALSPFAVELGFLVEEYSGGKGMIPPRKRRNKRSIFVCTIEKALVLLDSLIEAERANEIGLVVIDELHMIGDAPRGVNLEIMITKIQAIEAGIQIVGMSATIGNLNEIAKFLLADIYCRDFRPVELKEYVKCGDEMLEINSKADKLEDAFSNKRAVDFGYTEEQRRIDPDHMIGLVVEVIPNASCLVFCPTKRQCEQLCALLTEYLPRELLDYRVDEKEELINQLRSGGSTSDSLPQAFRVGIAYHHAGLTFDERKLIEDAYRMGIISLIISTSTLAAGVNLPAKRVIIRSPFIATNFLTLSRYKQMVGRAGRAGFGEHGDSILICSQKDIQAVCGLLCSPMDEANSSLHTEEFVFLKNLVLSTIGLGICTSRNDVQRFVTKTLLAIQADRLGVNLRKATDQALMSLYKENAIKTKTDACLRNPANMTIQINEAEVTQAEIELTGSKNGVKDLVVMRMTDGSSQAGKLVKTFSKSSRLEVNRLGKAAIRAGFHMAKAIRFYDEMKRIGERLNVLDELHLLYVIVLDDGGELRPTVNDYISFFNKLSKEDYRTAKRFNIGEYTISKILSNRTVPSDMLQTVRRFYRMLIVYDLWNLKPPQEVALKFKVDAGSIQTLMTNAASTASSLHRFCEEIQELWAFHKLLATMVQRLSHCCTAELIPLMELPAVKIARARQLYRAGFTSLTSIAKAKSRDIVESLENISYRTANQLILSAKAKLMEEVEALKDQAAEYMFLLSTQN
ncbi:helicase POLQ-like [Toxorhynchites rutilus septentrionalis]|uniref:helicase POLQ-like n=1 Tax=Toxorhynchites rutilus septentrionalis TaxID=329112 RepID=UPI0024783D08|nr:helicase POLQ-like [Toxorhynchites rutilus septentrionalis]